jgi:hypothetical protein
MAEKTNKLNGTAKWIIVILAIATIAYNSVATHVIAKNEVRHVILNQEKMDKKIDSLSELLLNHIIQHK